MPRLTAEEREARRRKVQDEALEAVAARGQFNFRLDGSDIKRLYELAGMRKRPVSAMVREWVLERLELEEGGKTQSPPWVQSLENRLSHTEVLITLLALRAPTNQFDDDIRGKLKEHVMRHCNVEADDELRALL